MANTTDQQLSSIYYNGYTYSVGDTIKISSNWYTNSYQSQPGNDITSYLSSTIFQITTIYNQDYEHWSSTYYPDNPITVKIVSSNASIVGQTGCIQLAQIVPGSGGKPDTYTVSFNANGGSGAPGAQTKTYGVTLTLSSTKPTRSGYEFIGWGSSTSDTSVDYNAGGSYTANAGTTLYAIWKKTITLSYNANGGSGAPGSQSATVYNATTSNKFTISSTKPTRTGYTFAGWSTSNTATSSSYNSGGSITLSSSDTLYAVWTEHYLTINYYSNYATAYSGTSEYPALNTVNNNNVLVFKKDYKYSGSHSNGLLNYKETGTSLYMYRTGYTATGKWGTSTSGGTLVDQDDETLNTGQKIAQKFGKDLSSGNASVNVYAQWDENYLTVNYYSNNATSYNGTATPENTVNNNNVLICTQKYYYDNAYSDGLNNYSSGSTLGMVRTGYSATGNWGTSTSGGTLVNQNTGFTTGQLLAEALNKNIKNGNASINIYAQWQENGLTVDYYSNYADYGTYQGDPLNVNASNNVLVYSKTYYYDDAYADGLNDIQNENYLYLSRTGYFSTGQWGTTSSGGILVDEKDSFATGQALAEAFGLSLKNGNASVIIYAQWEPANVAYYKNNGKYVLCNTYGKVDGQWQPMLLYGKINGAWVRSVTDE